MLSELAQTTEVTSAKKKRKLRQASRKRKAHLGRTSRRAGEGRPRGARAVPSPRRIHFSSHPRVSNPSSPRENRKLTGKGAGAIFPHPQVPEAGRLGRERSRPPRRKRKAERKVNKFSPFRRDRKKGGNPKKSDVSTEIISVLRGLTRPHCQFRGQAWRRQYSFPRSVPVDCGRRYQELGYERLS